MEITKEILEHAGFLATEHLINHMNEIDRAYQENQEILDINLKTRLSMNKNKFKIQADISFTAEKVKDSKTVWYDPDQRQLFSEEPADPE